MYMIAEMPKAVMRCVASFTHFANMFEPRGLCELCESIPGFFFSYKAGLSILSLLL
jgi:hypothetical protein